MQLASAGHACPGFSIIVQAPPLPVDVAPPRLALPPCAELPPEFDLPAALLLPAIPVRPAELAPAAALPASELLDPPHAKTEAPVRIAQAIPNLMILMIWPLAGASPRTLGNIRSRTDCQRVRHTLAGSPPGQACWHTRSAAKLGPTALKREARSFHDFDRERSAAANVQCGPGAVPDYNAPPS